MIRVCSYCRGEDALQVSCKNCEGTGLEQTGPKAPPVPIDPIPICVWCKKTKAEHRGEPYKPWEPVPQLPCSMLQSGFVASETRHG